jgi:hypothetical protein
METLYPTLVLLDAGNQIREARALEDDRSIPVVDKDAMFDILVDLIHERQTAEKELFFAGQSIMDIKRRDESNMLGIHPCDEEDDPALPFALEVAALKINRIGRALLDQVRQLKLFEEGGYLNYEYHETIHDQTLVLRRKRGVLHGP